MIPRSLLPEYIRKLADQQRAIRLNQRALTSEEAREQFERIHGKSPSTVERYFRAKVNNPA